MEPQRLWVNPNTGFTSASFSQYRDPNQAHSHIHEQIIDDFHIRQDQVGYDATPPLGTPQVTPLAQLQKQPNVDCKTQMMDKLQQHNLPTNPRVGGAPIHESVNGHVKAIKAIVQGLPDMSEKFMMLSLYEQQIQNEFGVYETLWWLIDAIKAFHTAELFDEKFSRAKQLFYWHARNAAITHKQVKSNMKIVFQSEVEFQEPKFLLLGLHKDSTRTILNCIQSPGKDEEAICVQMGELQRHLPNVVLVPICPRQSMVEQVKTFNAFIQGLPNLPEKFKLLSKDQQEIKNLLNQATHQVAIYDTMSCLMDALLARRTGEHFEEKLHQTKQMLFRQVIMAPIAQKHQKQSTPKFNKGLEEPELIPPPLGFHKDPRWTEVTYIRKQIRMCDPSEPGVKFKTLWTKIVRYSKGKYFTEAEYLDVLAAVLDGDSFVDFYKMERKKEPLHFIVNQLALNCDY
jgi:hypothetical protein